MCTCVEVVVVIVGQTRRTYLGLVEVSHGCAGGSSATALSLSRYKEDGQVLSLQLGASSLCRAPAGGCGKGKRGERKRGCRATTASKRSRLVQGRLSWGGIESERKRAGRESINGGSQQEGEAPRQGRAKETGVTGAKYDRGFLQPWSFQVGGTCNLTDAKGAVSIILSLSA